MTDELLAFVRERLGDADLEMRLNDASPVLVPYLFGLLAGLRSLVERYERERSIGGGDDWGGGYVTGLEDAIRWTAAHVWGRHPDFKPEWEG